MAPFHTYPPRHTPHQVWSLEDGIEYGLTLLPTSYFLLPTSYFLQVWSLEDGIKYGLTEESEGPQPDDKTKRALWDGDEWQTFFDMPSSRLMLLMPGDVAFLKAGAFHRVFTLETKVVAYRCAGSGFSHPRVICLALLHCNRKPEELDPGFLLPRSPPLALPLPPSLSHPPSSCLWTATTSMHTPSTRRCPASTETLLLVRVSRLAMSFCCCSRASSTRCLSK